MVEHKTENLCVTGSNPVLGNHFLIMFSYHIVFFSHSKKSQAQKKRKVYTFNKAHHANKKSKTSVAAFFYKQSRPGDGPFYKWSVVKHAFINNLSIATLGSPDTTVVFVKVTVCPYSLMVRT